MAEIVNLRRIKKQRARAEDAQRAAENRARHGTPKSEREKVALEERAATRHLDGARLSGDGEPPE